MKKVLFWLLIIFVVIPITVGIIMSIVTPNKTSTPTTTTQQTTKTTTTTSGAPLIGEMGYLYCGKDKDGKDQDVLVASTKEYFGEFGKLAAANDILGITQMVLQGDLFYVEPMTKVLVIDAGFTALQVRLYEGDNAGKTGWIPIEWCTKTKK